MLAKPIFPSYISDVLSIMYYQYSFYFDNSIQFLVVSLADIRYSYIIMKETEITLPYFCNVNLIHQMSQKCNSASFTYIMQVAIVNRFSIARNLCYYSLLFKISMSFVSDNKTPAFDVILNVNKAS